MGTGKSQLGPDAARRPAGEGEANRDATDVRETSRSSRRSIARLRVCGV